MEFLPPELLQIICTYLRPVPDLLRLQQVNRRWARQCSVLTHWRTLTVPPECFPGSYVRRTSWNRFAKRLNTSLTELHLTMPLTLRATEHQHPVKRAVSMRRTPVLGSAVRCNVCRSDLSDAYYICKLPACEWRECEACRMNVSVPLSLAPLSSLAILSVRSCVAFTLMTRCPQFDREGEWCWRMNTSGLSFQEKALRYTNALESKIAIVQVDVLGRSAVRSFGRLVCLVCP